MDAWVWILIAVVAVVLVGMAAWAAARRRRTSGLRDQFGPEYERTVGQTDGRREAEAELMERRARREALDIRRLTSAERDRYSSKWTNVQARFVDQPAASLQEADALVMDLMRERGYPMDDFDQRAADVSVDHPQVVEHYRAAHQISHDTAAKGTSTEDMRQGLVHYRALFEALLEVDPATGEGGMG
ncbi:MAG: hypothetical protein ACRDH0_02085 [Actinomycetota bacterium]|jgi:hypothetical protein